MKYHLIELGTICSDKLDAEYFDLMPDLTEENDETVDLIVCPLHILDETFEEPNCSAPHPANLPSIEVPSFIYPYELRQRDRKILPSKMKKRRVNPYK